MALNVTAKQLWHSMSQPSNCGTQCHSQATLALNVTAKQLWHSMSQPSNCGTQCHSQATVALMSQSSNCGTQSHSYEKYHFSLFILFSFSFQCTALFFWQILCPHFSISQKIFLLLSKFKCILIVTIENIYIFMSSVLLTTPLYHLWEDIWHLLHWSKNATPFVMHFC